MEHVGSSCNILVRTYSVKYVSLVWGILGLCEASQGVPFNILVLCEACQLYVEHFTPLWGMLGLCEAS